MRVTCSSQLPMGSSRGLASPLVERRPFFVVVVVVAEGESAKASAAVRLPVFGFLVEVEGLESAGGPPILAW